MLAHLVHGANKAFGPALALFLAGQMTITVSGVEVGKPLGVVLGALAMLIVELALVRAPKRVAIMRRWLDRRAMFEGPWIQWVDRGQPHNKFAVFVVSYDGDTDTYTLEGTAFSARGVRIAEWSSTQLYFATHAAELSYVWTGQFLGEHGEAPRDREGIASLQLTPAAAMSPPRGGSGYVDYLGEDTRLTFVLERVTASRLRELQLEFAPGDVHDLAKRAKLVHALVEEIRRGPADMEAGRMAS